MAIAYNSKIVTDGLLVSLDPSNIKSFQGIPLTNLSNAINQSYTTQNSTYFKVINTTSTQVIPGGVGEREVKSVTYYNDYSGGSGQCCPNFFSFETLTTFINVSPSTTYTYAIIVKSETNYFHENFLYRYEYDSGENYLSQGGIYDASRKISLGDDWYMIWGSFTTTINTTKIQTRLFTYEYATWNTISVAGSALYLGSDVVSPRHFPQHGETKTGIVSSSMSSSWTGTLVNGATYKDDDLGVFRFDGVDDRLYVTSSPTLLDYTFMFFVKWNGVTTNGSRCFGLQNYGTYTILNPGNVGYHYNPLGGVPGSTTIYSGVNVGYGNWAHICVSETRDGSSAKIYVNGELGGQTTLVSAGGFQGAFVLGGQKIDYDDVLGNCDISHFNLYNRVLTDNEIKQNFNATRGRFGI